MIRFRLAEVLAERDWTAYRLAQETGLTVQAAYRLARTDKVLQRLDVDTLDRLCAALRLQPGDLLEYQPDKKRR